MPFISSVGQTYRAQSVPKQRTIPANALIPYYGTSGWPSDWTWYPAADGKFIHAAGYPEDIGTTNYGESASFTFGLYTSSAGAHTGPTFRTTISSETGGNMYQINSVSSNHQHYTEGSSININIQAATQNICFLRSTRPTTKFPINSLIFKANSVGMSGAESFTSSDGLPRYLVGSSTDLTTNSAITSGSGSTGTDLGGYHEHTGQIGGFKSVLRLGDDYGSQNFTGDGNHRHTITASYSQSSIDSRLYNLWKLVVAKSLTKDMIVMYVGSLSTLPSPWYFCNGQNGTVDIRGPIIGYSDGNTWGNVVVHNGHVNFVNLSTHTELHDHSTGIDRYANRGEDGQHSNYQWNHTHTIDAYSHHYSPTSIGVAFIQYKG